MKNKFMIALVLTALVLGIVLVACDSGELPTIDQPVTSKETILEKQYGMFPYIDKIGEIQGNTGNTVGKKYGNEYLVNKNGFIRIEGQLIDKGTFEGWISSNPLFALDPSNDDDAKLIDILNDKLGIDDIFDPEAKFKFEKLSTWDLLEEYYIY